MFQEFSKALTEKTLFEKSGFVEVLQQVANSSMQYYGFPMVPIDARWDSDNPDVAWINNEKCYINLDSPLTKGCTFTERKVYITAKMVHEIFGHWLHTDFSKMKELQESLDNSYYQYFRDTSNCEEIMKCYKENRKLFEKIFFSVANIVEDPVIEYLAVKKYPGFKSCIEKLTKKLQMDLLSFDQEEVPEYVKIFNLVLMKARNCLPDKQLEIYPELGKIDCFNDLSGLPTYEDRLRATAQIISLLWEYIKPVFEDKEKEKQTSDFLDDLETNNNINDGTQPKRTDSNSSDEINDNSNTSKSDTSTLKKETRKTLEQIEKILEKELNKNKKDVVSKIYADTDKKEISKIIDEFNMSNEIEEGIASYCININFDSDINRYHQVMSADKKRIAHHCANKVSSVLSTKRRGAVFRGLSDGCMLDIDAYASGEDKVFMDIKKPSKRAVCAVSIAIDLSSSMQANSRNEAALNTALVISQFCKELKLPQLIYGFHEISQKSYIERFLDFSETINEVNQSKLLNILQNNGKNHDGLALRFGLSKLKARKEQQKILFVISDGLPNGTNYHESEMIKDVPFLRKKYKKYNILIIPIAIGDDIEKLNNIYGNIVDGRNLEDLPITVSRILLSEVKKIL